MVDFFPLIEALTDDNALQLKFCCKGALGLLIHSWKNKLMWRYSFYVSITITLSTGEQMSRQVQACPLRDG